MAFSIFGGHSTLKGIFCEFLLLQCHQQFHTKFYTEFQSSLVKLGLEELVLYLASIKINEKILSHQNQS